MAKKITPKSTSKPLATNAPQPVATRKKRKKKKARKRKILTQQEIEQNFQKKEIRNLMSNIGFSRVPQIDGKHFVYDGSVPTPYNLDSFLKVV